MNKNRKSMNIYGFYSINPKKSLLGIGKEKYGRKNRNWMILHPRDCICPYALLSKIIFFNSSTSSSMLF